jgi:hypothetical protein
MCEEIESSEGVRFASLCLLTSQLATTVNAMAFQINTCRVCRARWKSYDWFNAHGRRDRDWSLCEPCNDASIKSLDATAAELEEQRRRRVEHFGNDGT